MLKNFRSYQLAKELYRECQKQPITGSAREQMIRASLSVCLNLAEGSGKLSQKERRRFYGIAYASTKEVQACIDLHDLETAALADQVGACIFKLLRALDG